MKSKLTKSQAEAKIGEFFESIKDKEKEQVRKIKRLAMHYKIRLGEKRKTFCQKCFSVNLKTLGIKNNVKRVKCLECGKIYRWKLKINSS